MANLTFDPNNFLIKIEYLKVMPRKKLVYLSRTQNNERFYTKKTGFQPNQPIYEYIEIKKIFNIFECPLKWQLPLFLCIKYCDNKAIPIKCMKFN